MTALDMALLLLMGGMAVTGFMRGFVQEVLSLVAWGVAVIAVRLFLAPVTDLAGLWIGAGAAASLLSFVGLFALTFVAGKFVAGRVGDGVRSSLIGPVDRVLGAGFGLARGVVVLLLVAVVVGLTPMEASHAWQHSRMAAWLNEALQQIHPWLPQRFARHQPFAVSGP